jgi:hypothetical protein
MTILLNNQIIRSLVQTEWLAERFATCMAASEARPYTLKFSACYGVTALLGPSYGSLSITYFLLCVALHCRFRLTLTPLSVIVSVWTMKFVVCISRLVC